LGHVQATKLAPVLLTQLEYFQGVLIMTTNRIMSIDIAVQSRLHYAIRFGYPSEDEIRNIVGTFHKQLDHTNCSAGEKNKIETWLEDNLDSMKDRYGNGRDIRSLFMSTQWLSRKDGGKITLRHLQTVYRAAQSFRSQMEKTRLKKEAETALGNKGGY
jgi:AAA+ superfamily predicted ATPase